MWYNCRWHIYPGNNKGQGLQQLQIHVLAFTIKHLYDKVSFKRPIGWQGIMWNKQDLYNTANNTHHGRKETKRTTVYRVLTWDRHKQNIKLHIVLITFELRVFSTWLIKSVLRTQKGKAKVMEKHAGHIKEYFSVSEI